MELITKYLELNEYRGLEIEERLGLCHQVISNPHTLNQLTVRAIPDSIKAYCNGILLDKRRDYVEIHTENGSYICFVHKPDHNTPIELFYEGYTQKGDAPAWRW